MHWRPEVKIDPKQQITALAALVQTNYWRSTERCLTNREAKQATNEILSAHSFGLDWYPTTSRSKPVMDGIFLGLASSFIFPTPISRKIWAPIP